MTEASTAGMRGEAELVLSAGRFASAARALGRQGSRCGSGRAPKGAERGAGQGPFWGSQISPPSRGARAAWAGSGVAFCAVGQWGCARLWFCGCFMVCRTIFWAVLKSPITGLVG